MKHLKWTGLLALVLLSCATDYADPIEDLESDVGGPDGVAQNVP